MKISFITTVFDEEKTIDNFLDSLVKQTELPDEVVIVDGGSTDTTISRIKKYEAGIKGKKIRFEVFIKPGNRSVGRNEAIKNATGDIIICSDAGNILDKNWVKNITKPFNGPPLRKATERQSNKVDVVAGYYRGKANTIFQKCIVLYALVMPDKVDPERFLPATRSIAFTKAIWKKVGGFDESLSHNEDYVFARKLKECGAKIVFAKDAIVNWIPRNTYKEAFIMFYRFALGDAEAGIFRTNVILLFSRYFLGLYFLFLVLLYRSLYGLVDLGFLVVLYIFWSIWKNYRYIRDKRALLLLPKLQFTADVAVLSGTLHGISKRLQRFSFRRYIKDNRWLYVIAGIYIGISLWTIQWGIPNENRPFPFHMDEWHQLQAVGNTFRYGTPNVEGSANGTMFHFLYSGFYLLPFTVLQYVNPFALQIDNALMRERIFEVLRFQTIIFGTLSMIILYHIVKFLKAPGLPALLLFTFTPLWLVLSGYFKYDIALIFFILLSFYSILRFSREPYNTNYILAAIPTGLAVAVKVSAIPLLPLYILSYFLFKKEKGKNRKFLFFGTSLFLGIVLLFGLPDTVFGKGNILYYLYDNIHQTPTASLGFMLHSHPLVYLFTKQFPVIFGYGLYISTIFSFIYWCFKFMKTGLRMSLKIYKYELLIVLSFLLFLISILPLQVYAGGNRSLVLLPFMVLLIAVTMRILLDTQYKHLLVIFFILASGIQIYQSYSWLSIKSSASPHEKSSEWIQRNIPQGVQIGLENIPIYQHLPDIIQKEFYFQQYNISYNYSYQYQVIDEESKSLPEVIIITNEDMEKRLLSNSPKTELVNRLYKEQYSPIVSFTPDFTYYKTFGNETDFYLANIVPMPLTTTIYKRVVK